MGSCRAEYGTHSLRTKASMIYKATGNICAIRSCWAILGVDIEDALTPPAALNASRSAGSMCMSRSTMPRAPQLATDNHSSPGPFNLRCLLGLIRSGASLPDFTIRLAQNLIHFNLLLTFGSDPCARVVSDRKQVQQGAGRRGSTRSTRPHDALKRANCRRRQDAKPPGLGARPAYKYDG